MPSAFQPPRLLYHQLPGRTKRIPLRTAVLHAAVWLCLALLVVVINVKTGRPLLAVLALMPAWAAAHAWLRRWPHIPAQRVFTAADLADLPPAILAATANPTAPLTPRLPGRDSL